jgi:integrase
VRHRRTFDTKTAADDWLTTARSEVKAGIHTPDAKSVTVREAARLWLQARTANGLERGSLRAYEQYVRLYTNRHLGAVKLSRLTTPMVAAFRNTLLKETSRHRARKVLSALRLTLNEMQCTGLVAQNVAAVVHVERPSERDERALEVGIDVPSPAEVRAMLQHAQGRDRVRLILATFTGLRASEMRGLRFSAGTVARCRTPRSTKALLGCSAEPASRARAPMASPRRNTRHTSCATSSPRG